MFITITKAKVIFMKLYAWPRLYVHPRFLHRIHHWLCDDYPRPDGENTTLPLDNMWVNVDNTNKATSRLVPAEQTYKNCTMSYIFVFVFERLATVDSRLWRQYLKS